MQFLKTFGAISLPPCATDIYNHIDLPSLLGMTICIITYVSEISTAEYRGVLLALIDVTFNFGLVVCSTLMYYLKWNVVSIIFVVFTVLSVLLILILPESPVWLYSTGKKEKALKNLCYIRSQNREQLQPEIQEMEKSSIKNTNKKATLSSTAKNCLNAWKQVAIAVGTFGLMLHSGIFIIMAYTVTFVQYLKLPYDSNTIAVIYTIVGFVGSFLTPLFIHNFNRKAMLTVSSFGMGLSLLVISVYEEIFLHADVKYCAWIVPVALCAFVFASNTGVVPIGFVISGEIFPLEIRGTLQGIFGCVICIYWALTVKIYPYIIFDVSVKVFLWACTVSCFLLALFGIFVLPETRGKTLEEVQERYFRKKGKSERNEKRKIFIGGQPILLAEELAKDNI